MSAMQPVLIFLLSLNLSLNVTAAPHPGMGSSALNSIQNGSIFSMMGFKLASLPMGWNFISNPAATEDSSAKESTKDFQIDLAKNFSSGADLVARISFKSEITSKKVDLESFVKKYLRDYNQFGFDVSGLQSMRENKSVIVDINQKNKKTRSRQMFFQKGQRIVLATCTSEFENFDKAVTDCNQIFSGITWK
jgi:hypothetical protein